MAIQLGRLQETHDDGGPAGLLDDFQNLRTYSVRAKRDLSPVIVRHTMAQARVRSFQTINGLHNNGIERKTPRVYRVRVDSLSPLRRSAAGLAMWAYVPIDLSSAIQKVAHYPHADRGSSNAAWEFHEAWHSQCAHPVPPPYHSYYDRNLMHWFTSVLSEGDTVIAIDVTQRWFVGRVSGGYQFNGRGRWPHRRQIDWLPDTLAGR